MVSIATTLTATGDSGALTGRLHKKCDHNWKQAEDLKERDQGRSSMESLVRTWPCESGASRESFLRALLKAQCRGEQTLIEDVWQG